MAAGEFSRNARLVLRLMGKADARLVEAGAGAWVIESGRNRRRSRQTVADDMVRELAARECLVREPAGGYRISVAGERLMAGEGEDSEEGVGGQHRLLRRQKGKGRRGTTGPALNEAESPLGWLRSRRDRHGEPLISQAQYDAGERLRVDYTLAQLSPRVTLSWDGCIAPGSNSGSRRRADSLEISERAITAKQRFMHALDAVGPEVSGILVDVCCLARGLEAAERSLGWPQRSGKLVLQIGLTQLARHYGLLRAERDPNRPHSTRHWGMGDYRPRVGFITGEADGSEDQA